MKVRCGARIRAILPLDPTQRVASLELAEQAATQAALRLPGVVSGSLHFERSRDGTLDDAGLPMPRLEAGGWLMQLEAAGTLEDASELRAGRRWNAVAEAAQVALRGHGAVKVMYDLGAKKERA